MHYAFESTLTLRGKFFLQVVAVIITKGETEEEITFAPSKIKGKDKKRNTAGHLDSDAFHYDILK